MTLVIGEEARRPVTGKKSSSGSNSFFQSEFVQLLHEGKVSVRMCRTDSVQLSHRLADEM